MAPSEVLSTERRRKWSADDKARIVAETLEPGISVSDVARRHGLSSGLLFDWRRKMRTPGSAPLLPVTIATGSTATPSNAVITIETPSGYRLRVGPDVSPQDLRRVLEALAGR